MNADDIQYALNIFKNDEPGMRSIYGDLIFDTIVECLADSISRAQVAAPVVSSDLESIADVVLKSAGSGGLRNYMAYTKEKIIADLKAYFERQAS